MPDPVKRKVVTKADIVDSVREKTGLPRRTLAKLVDDMLEIIRENLENGENVKISGFGAFRVQQKNARRGRNPRSGEEITIGPKTVVSFKPSRVLKKAINSSGSGS